MKQTNNIIRVAIITLLLAMTNIANAASDKVTELPGITVSDKLSLDENSLVGPNKQPEWTTSRRFSTTRVYVLPPWQVELEQWWKGKFDGGDESHLFQSEVGIGLPNRFQLDLYENIEHVDGDTEHSAFLTELRWAMADWGVIPLNPTLYGEWKFNDSAADAYEVKLLLGDNFGEAWHWGLNLFYEQQVGDNRETEMGVSQAISYSLIDSTLAVGAEMKYENVSEDGARSDAANEFLLGPSIQWRITRNTHLDIVPLFGCTSDSPDVEAYIVLGIEFGGSEGQVPYNPASSRAR